MLAGQRFRFGASCMGSVALLGVLILPGTNVFAQSKAAAKAGTAATQTRPVTAAKAATGEPVDLNTATPDQLKALPGIGDAYAKRIVDGRPYTMKNQVVQRGIVPQSTYDKIKDNIVAHKMK